MNPPNLSPVRTSVPAVPPDMVILYVRHALEAAALYTDILGQAPVEASPGFALFVLPGGWKLGLWTAADVMPQARAAGGTELCLAQADLPALQACLDRWTGLGLRLVQPVQAMDFGTTATVEDPDGHRLRVFTPTPPPGA